MKTVSRILACAAMAIAAFGQGGPAPVVPQQFFSNNGIPVASGTVCTYTSGTSTPLVTYTSATLGTPNPACVPLDGAGRASIWIGNAVYRFVLKSSTGSTIWTQDGIGIVAPLSLGGYWALSSGTLYNGGGSGTSTKVCLSVAGGCTTALALLNLNGASSGNNLLLRIDDSANLPGLNLYGSGVAYGSYAADSGGLQLRNGTGASQMSISTGNVLVHNFLGGGATTLDVQAGTGQATTDLFHLKTSAGTDLAWADHLGNFVAPLFNSSSTGGSITFQNSNSNFSVDGDGNISAARKINMVGGGGAAYQVNGTTIVDNAGNATVNTLTCVTTPCGNAAAGVTTQSDVTGSRSIGTVYHNTGSTAMMVTVAISGNGIGSEVDALTDASTPPTTKVGAFAGGVTLLNSISFWVLPGNYYEITQFSTGAVVESWIEWQ